MTATIHSHEPGPDIPPSAVRVRYLHGRPGPHPQHGRFAESVGARFDLIDFRLRWQDKSRPKPYVIASWLLCAATLPERRKYDVFLVDNLHIMPVVMKRLFLRKDQKIVAYMGSHTLYFLLSHRFSRLVERLHIWALRNYDAILCEGRMSVDIAQRLLGETHAPIYESLLAPSVERLRRLREVEPDLESRRLLLISSGPGEFRMHYKGLDLMVDAVSIASQSDPTLEFDILGEWDAEIVDAVTARIPSATRQRIRFRGRVDGIADWLQRTALYLHCARGDAFPTATIEAMSAGVVPLVSEWTGTREIVAEVCDRLIAPLNSESIAERILWYFGLAAGERQRLSRRSRIAARPYTQDSASAHFESTFTRMCQDLGLAPTRQLSP